MDRLSENLRQEIATAYAQEKNYSAVARRFEVTPKTVRNIITKTKTTVCDSPLISDSSNTSSDSCDSQDDANTACYLNGKREIVHQLIDLYLDELGNKERIANAPLNQLATVLNTLIDKSSKGEVTPAKIILNHQIPRAIEPDS